MTTGLTDFTTEKVGNFYLRGTAWAQPSTVYIGLDSVLGTKAGGGTEIAGAGYARQALAPSSVVSRGITNTASMVWTPSETWLQCVGWRAWDAATGGNALAFGPLSPKPTPGVSSPYVLAAGEWSFSLPALSLLGEVYPISDWYVGKVLDKVFRNVTGAGLYGSLKAHLIQVKPSLANSGGTFPAASGYAPQSAAFAAWASGRNYLSSNITFEAAAVQAYGAPLVAWGLYDGNTPGTDHLLFLGDLTPIFTVGVGNPVILRAADTFVGIKQDTTI